MPEEGVQFLAGTDVGVLFMYPGFSLHDELEKLVREVGFTLMEALRIATSGVPAFYRETNSFGAVETGQAVNLVLLDADPLIDIRNTRRVLAVSVGGRWLDRTKLDHLYIAASGAKCTSGVPRADREVTRRFSVGLPLAARGENRFR